MLSNDMPPPPYALQEKWTVRQFSLNFKHVFSIEYLYKRVHEWLLEEGYCSVDSGPKSDKWMEKMYLERISGNNMKQIWVWWRSDKPYDNPFFKIYLNVDFHVLGLQDHEIVVNNQKIKTNKGEVETFITARLQLDPSGDWDKNFLLRNKYFQKFYLNRIYKKKIEQVENEVVRDAARLLGAIKQYFQMESWLPEYAGPGYHPAKGE
jgi:hypothetical protein